MPPPLSTIISPFSSIILLLIVGRIVYTRWVRNKIFHRPPGPNPVPFIGNVHQLPMQYQERAIWDWGKTYGEIIYARFFRRHAIMINSAEVAQDLMEKRSANYSDRPPFILQCDLMGWHSMPILMRYTPHYRKLRKWLHEAFMSKATLKTYIPIQRRETYVLLAGLMNTPEEFVSHFTRLALAQHPGPIAIPLLMSHRFTAGTIAEIAYGHTVTGLEDTYIHLSDKAAGATVEAGSPGSMLVDFIPILRHWPTWLPGSGWKRNALAIRALGEEMINYPYNMVKEKMAAGTAKPCLVTRLIGEYANKEGELAAEVEDDIKNAAAVLYGAGTETTANVLTVFMLAMTKHPEVFKKAQEEIDRVIGHNRLPDFDDRDSLPYLNCVIKEVYRWHPPTPLGVPHYSMKDDEYRGYSIPAESMIIPNIWGMTRNTGWYNNPEDFCPERFDKMDELTSNVTDPKNLIFGFGRRKCVASAFADANAYLVMANIIATMNISRAQDERGFEINPPHAYKSGFTHYDPGFIGAHDEIFHGNLRWKHSPYSCVSVLEYVEQEPVYEKQFINVFLGMAALTPPAVLTIAGTDPSGGAGIQADLKTFTAHQCYGTSVVTALTAQNTRGVQGVHPCPPEFVEQQLDSVLSDIDVKAIKTGMLHDAPVIRAISKALTKRFASNTSLQPPLVCDPVCVSTSGHGLLQPEAVDVLIQELFPITTLLTPNRSEAELLLSRKSLPSTIESLEDMLRAAKDLLSIGPKAVLLKGGHITASPADVERIELSHPDVKVIRDGLLAQNMEILQIVEGDAMTQSLVVDVLQEHNSTVLFVRPRVDSTSTHGTGCTLSAALVCALSRGANLVDATHQATTYTHLGIELAQPIGGGHGPLNHVHSVMTRAIPLPTKSIPHPFTRMLILSTASVWKSYVEHDFVKQLSQGSLPKECFLHFIKQDYLYLKYYARAYGLMAAKSTSFPSISNSTRIISDVLTEVSNHKKYCLQWGITEQDLENTPESNATTAYGAFILDVGLRGDASKLLMALAACLLGYGEVGLWIKKEASKPKTRVVLEGNPYIHWITEYGGEGYQQAVKLGIDAIEEMARLDPPSPGRLEEWREVWERCTKLEKGFWDMALTLA
ncbi:hypothetical protein NLI96_g3767 [Meripilus lineatus]|uniref:Uncharacterized protein n=1 Tax=Meripilus lineatus TaxID=2056292 RepID=A0AAD5YGA6_9APHY|nr:hypothetical protein NLI96_g3767 [Physisporinus lineatus]